MYQYIIRLVFVISFLFVFSTLSIGQQLVKENVEPQQITSNYEFTEGPLWHSSGYLLFSDIPANTVYKWSAEKGASTYLKPSGHANGLTFDNQGHLLLAQHDGAIARENERGEITVVIDNYKGKRLNSPNDLVVKSDGSIYFTDPSFGVSDEDKELAFQGVYRYSKKNGLQLLVDDFALPNGIVFSPDEEKLYVNDSKHNHIRVFKVKKDGTVGSGEVFATMESEGDGAADGMKVDKDGNLYSTGPGGLWIFSPSGELLQQLESPRITNLAWGGAENKTLFMTAPNAVYKLKMTKEGIQ
ncbi:SMP-30/gluconolactonase/LRE family protein [Aliifodinibius halophilus]|uniref:SMP-30/gluconolactonase/LRE family protein n=2 Tax=Fodinibius halophilus TaxID=1736908 RepID=A0A6M1SW17_9BACT|nr:SMP-30/gluconolactonase/LRE family protein [Fodinibius halophilus]